jgi:hypothetical protein
VAKKRFLVLFVFLSGFCVGPVFSQSDFYELNSVREIRIHFDEPNWKHLLDSLYINYGEDGRLLGDVSIDGITLNNVGVRYKGYSSWSSTQVKTPFNIDLEATISNQNYQGITKLKLSNVIQDPSFVREVLSYEIARKYMPASQANFANVYVNDTLLGLYTNVEAVDKNLMEKHYRYKNNSFFKGAPEDLIIPDGQNANLVYYDSDSSSYKPFYKLESDNSETGWPDLVRLIDVLNNDTASIDTILNIDRTLWMHAINYSLVNLDSYIGYSQNYYLYMDQYGRFNPILWDFNMSFGSFKETDGISAPPGGLTILKRKTLNPIKMLTSTPMSPRPLIINLLKNTTYKRMFLAHMRTIINENFKNNYYLARGQEIQDFIDSYVQNDTNKFYPYSQFHLNLDTTVGSGNDIFPGLRDLMEARVAYLDSFPGFSGAPVISEIQYEPEFPVSGNEIWITANVSGASEIFLNYRYNTDGKFKRVNMYDDGNHHDSISGDGIFGASVLTSGSVIQYYIYAQNDSAGIFSPERAEYEFYSIQPKLNPGDIVINELMAVNINIAVDQNNEYDGWIEVYNNTTENLSLQNLFLSDDSLNITKWAFPDTTVSAHSFIIVWADNDISQNGLHSGFKLSEEGGNLFISCNNNQIIDSVEYRLQITGKTYGRYPNGYGNFVYMPPTFSKNNQIGTTPSAEFLLYPNPASGNVYLEMQNSDIFVSYKVYDSKGLQVISRNFDFKSATNSEVCKIDISGLNNGLYVIIVETPDNSLFKKFIIFN